MVWLFSSFILSFSLITLKNFFNNYFLFFILIMFLFYFTLFYFIFFLSFFLPFILSYVDDRLFLLQPGVRAVPLRWESQVQDIGSPETSQLHVISNDKISQRSPFQRQDPAALNDQQATVLDTLCQTISKTGTQTHPLAERLSKIIIRSQTPQNTPLDVDLPTRKTRSRLIHQNTGTSPLYQEAYTTH